MLGTYSSFRMKWYIYSKKYIIYSVWADQKAYKLEISGPCLRFLVIYMYMRPVQEFLVSVQHGTGEDRSEVVVRLVSCKCIERNV